MVIARPTKEEVDFFEKLNITSIKGAKVIPNIVTDIYKVRSGEWNQVRIWSLFDYGNLRKEDLYMTDSRMNLITDYERHFIYEIDWEDVDYTEVLKKVNEIK